MSHIRKAISSLLAVAIATPVFAAPPASIGKGEGALNIIAWAGYVERGETDKN